MRAAWLLAFAFLLLGVSAARAARAVPPIEGHVTDTARVLAPSERADLEQQLERDMERSGAEIAVFVVDSLEGETIEDVAYRTFNAWKIGRDKLDDGVLLVIAPRERQVRIETGKGIGGRLTDLQASDIIERRIVPALRVGRYHDAIADGTDAIAAAIGGAGAPMPLVRWDLASATALAMLLIFFVGGVFFRGRLAAWFCWWGGGGWPGGGGFFGGDSRRGGGSFFGGGRGGGGYSGGGGRSGGGGASGRW